MGILGKRRLCFYEEDAYYKHISIISVNFELLKNKIGALNMQIEEIYEFLNATDTVYLSTIDKDKKEPRVRVMGLISYDKQYWLTSKSSRKKIEQIRANNRFEFCTLIRQGTNIGTIRARGTITIIEKLSTKIELAKAISFFDTYWTSPEDPAFALLHLNIEEFLVQSPFDSEHYRYRLTSEETTEDEWRTLLEKNLDDVVGKELRTQIIPEGVDPAATYTGSEIIDWTIAKIQAVDDLIPELDQRCETLTRCAHIMPDSRVKIYRDIYEKHHSVDEVLAFMQTSFIARLEERFDLTKEQRKAVLESHWGEAGYRDGNTIIATKMPAQFLNYFEASTDIEQRRAYCHCGRIRASIGDPDKQLSSTYCYCGGGFYKSNWERTLSQKVEVKLMQSVLQGDKVCQFKITLPEGIE
jgi:uncharacterized pyridoxamine 5'-phosphate oxidase family protein